MESLGRVARRGIPGTDRGRTGVVKTETPDTICGGTETYDKL
jgi:hypothetical protein